MLAFLKRITDNVLLIPGRTNIGVIVIDEHECVVVDSGIDDDSARKVINTLARSGFKIRALVNTHSHADHIGGNAFMHKRLGINIYAPHTERPFIENPILEPLYLYGAYPPRELRSKLYCAKPSPTKDIDELLNEVSFEVIELPGHSLGMVGLGMGKVLFIADTLFPKEVLSKYIVPYHLSVSDAVKSIERIKELSTEYEVFIPSHGNILNRVELLKLIDENLNSIRLVRSEIMKLLERSSLSLDELLNRLIVKLNIKVLSLGQYMLLRSAINSYLTWLEEDNVVRIDLVNGIPHIRRYT